MLPFGGHTLWDARHPTDICSLPLPWETDAQTLRLEHQGLFWPSLDKNNSSSPTLPLSHCAGKRGLSVKEEQRVIRPGVCWIPKYLRDAHHCKKPSPTWGECGG